MKYADFLTLNKELLHCYHDITPDTYKYLSYKDQQSVCYPERRKVENALIQKKVALSDFFTAARAN